MPPISTARKQIRCGCRVFRFVPFGCVAACCEDTVYGFRESSVTRAVAAPCVQATARCKFLVLNRFLANVRDTWTLLERLARKDERGCSCNTR